MCVDGIGKFAVQDTGDVKELDDKLKKILRVDVKVEFRELSIKMIHLRKFSPSS